MGNDGSFTGYVRFNYFVSLIDKDYKVLFVDKNNYRYYYYYFPNNDIQLLEIKTYVVNGEIKRNEVTAMGVFLEEEEKKDFESNMNDLLKTKDFYQLENKYKYFSVYPIKKYNYSEWKNEMGDYLNIRIFDLIEIGEYFYDKTQKRIIVKKGDNKLKLYYINTQEMGKIINKLLPGAETEHFSNYHFLNLEEIMQQINDLNLNWDNIPKEISLIISDTDIISKNYMLYAFVPIPYSYIFILPRTFSFDNSLKPEGVIAHEKGHILREIFLDPIEREKYLTIRNINNDGSYEGSITETFAEDFRLTYGNTAAKLTPHMNINIPTITDEIKQQIKEMLQKFMTG